MIRLQRAELSDAETVWKMQVRCFARLAITEAEYLHGAEQWALDTILQESGLCRFYEKLGYKDTGKREKINDKLTLVFYEK